MLWNIQKIARYSDAFMVLDNKVLRFNGNLRIEKVNVSEFQYTIICCWKERMIREEIEERKKY